MAKKKEVDTTEEVVEKVDNITKVDLKKTEDDNVVKVDTKQRKIVKTKELKYKLHNNRK